MWEPFIGFPSGFSWLTQLMNERYLGGEHCLHYQGSSQELDTLRILDAEILVRLKYNKTNGDEKRRYQIKVYASCNY